jgi:hypothetical protein
MKDVLAHLEKQRKDAAEWEQICDFATERHELFDRLSAHLHILADEVERDSLQRSSRPE